MLHTPLSQALARNRGYLALNYMVLPTPSAPTTTEQDAIVSLFQADGVKQALGAGMVELFSGHCALAMPHLQEYLGSHPADEITAYWIGRCDSESGDWQSAIPVWKSARLLRPLQDAGNLLASQQNWKLASQAYDAVLTVTPNDCVYKARASSAAWWANQDAATALSQIQRVVADCPNQVEGYLVLGRILIEEGQFSTAETYLTRAREMEPYADSPLVNLALLNLRENRPEDGLTLLESAIAINPQRADTYALLGTCYTALRQPAQAIHAYETAIRLDPSQAWVYEALGAGYEAVGQVDQARTAYQHALLLDPRRTAARARLAKLTSPK